MPFGKFNVNFAKVRLIRTVLTILRGAFLGNSRFMFAIGKCKNIRVSLFFPNGEGALWEIADMFKSL